MFKKHFRLHYSSLFQIVLFLTTQPNLSNERNLFVEYDNTMPIPKTFCESICILTVKKVGAFLTLALIKVFSFKRQM